MSFTLPDLPYAYDALASKGMSQETLEFHHDLHHKAYVDNGNKLLAESDHKSKSLEEIVVATYASGALMQSGLFNNASQHWNHIQFWEMMTPGGEIMPPELENSLGRAFWFGGCVQKRVCRRWCWAVWVGLVLVSQTSRWCPRCDQNRKWR